MQPPSPGLGSHLLILCFVLIHTKAYPLSDFRGCNWSHSLYPAYITVTYSPSNKSRDTFSRQVWMRDQQMSTCHLRKLVVSKYIASDGTPHNNKTANDKIWLWAHKRDRHHADWQNISYKGTTDSSNLAWIYREGGPVAVQRQWRKSPACLPSRGGLNPLNSEKAEPNDIEALMRTGRKWND